MKNLLKSIVLSFRIDGSIWGLIYLLLLHPLGGWGQATRSVAKPTAPAGAERRLALVVGNKDYGRPDARLQNPLNDANDMAATLRNLGFEVITRSNLDRSSLETAIDDFASRLQGYDVGLFYFSGHGMAVQGENYLLPTDANLTYETQARSQCVSLRRVLDGMEGANAKVGLVLLDACRNNPFKRSWSRSTAPNGFVIPNNPRGSMVAFATRDGSTADDNVGERNGLFTAELLKHLPSPNLGLRGILDRTIEGVERRSGGRQVPGRYDELRGDFVFLASQTTTPSDAVVVAPSSGLPRLVSGTTKDLPLGPRMVYVAGSTFEMGNDDAKPVYSVTLGDFWIAQTEVTVGQYLAFCTATNSHWPEWLEKGNNYHVETGSNKYYADKGYDRQATQLPIVGVSWHDAVAYADWLTQKTGFRYGLPTEAQWEYAARGGRLSNGHQYAGSGNIGEVAWTSENANARPQAVGQKAKNELGLYDMSGNVWEWCSDWYGTYPNTPQTNPTGPATSPYRVLRGGSWAITPTGARVANRNNLTPGIRDYYCGFRLVSQFQ